MKAAIITLIEYPLTIPPLGSAIITACLNDAGHDAVHLMEFVDVSDRKYDIVIKAKEDAQRIRNTDRIVRKIERLQPDMVGFSCYIANRASTSAIAAALRKEHPEILLIAGGPDIHPTMNEPSGIDVLKDIVDFLVQGEGEERVIQLLDAVQQNRRTDTIPGVFDCSKGVGEVDWLEGYKTRLDDLDRVPIPDFSDNPGFHRFRDGNGWWAGIPVNISRGCSGNCSFCNRNEYFRGIRFRSAERVYAELVYQYIRYGEKRFVIVDDDPLAAPGLAVFEELAGLLITGDHGFELDIYNARLSNRIADGKWADLLKRAGVVKIQFGVESFSPLVRKHMRKPVNADVVEAILENFSGAGIRTGIYLIYGYASETDDDFRLTLDWLREKGSMCDTMNINCFILSDAFVKKRPLDFRFVKPKAGQPLSYWESDQVDNEIMWQRYHRIKAVMDAEVNAWYSLSDPNGIYIHGGKSYG